MDKVILQFQTPQDLSAFRKFAKEGISDLNIVELQLTCDCSKEIIGQAITGYGATVVKELSRQSA
jgi:hypothetical protein